MLKTARVFWGLFWVSIATIMAIATIIALYFEVINPASTYSRFDLMMNIFVCLGCAGSFALGGVLMIKDRPFEQIMNSYKFLVFIAMFALGALYTAIGSPL